MARYTGKSAALYVANAGTFSAVADIYDWEISTEVVTHDVSIKGDKWERQIPSHGRGRLTAKRYVQTTLVLAQNILAAIDSGTRIDWAVVAIDTGVNNWTTNANVKIQGTGFIDRGSASAPRGPVQDNWELILDTEPSTFQ